MIVRAADPVLRSGERKPYCEIKGDSNSVTCTRVGGPGYVWEEAGHEWPEADPKAFSGSPFQQAKSR